MVTSSIAGRTRWVYRHAADGGGRFPSADGKAFHDRPIPINGDQSLLDRLMSIRGIHGVEAKSRYLEPKLTDLDDPSAIPGLSHAARRIAAAIDTRQPVVIYGDYDVDGVTASAILWHTLRQLGANVQTYIPHRIDEGYGLNEQAIRELCDAHEKPLIVSVDCGITAVGPAAVAREHGVDLIITDHHEFDVDRLPDAHTLVHPGLPGGDGETRVDASPLCGAGVAFKLAWQVARERLCAPGSDRLPDAMRELMVDLLSLAALGTVADIVPLVGENRVITRFGLGRIKQTRFDGLNALIDVANLRDEKIDAMHVGFILGPRLNACGRMGHARTALRLLTSARRDNGQADALAVDVDAVNKQRQEAERAVTREAVNGIQQDGYDSEDRRGLVVAAPGWHQGVVGIVASRLVDRFTRPAIVLSIDEASGTATGSARSVDGVNIHACITRCASHLDRFGGHAMAAGLGLRVDAIDAFREAFIDAVNEAMPVEALGKRVVLDADVTLSDCDHRTFADIQRLSPFGRGNERPLLCLRDAELAQPPKPVGARGQHVQLFLKQGDRQGKAIYFNAPTDREAFSLGSRLDIAFEPKVNVWNGRQYPELIVKDVRPAGA